MFPRHPIASRRESHVRAPDKIVIDGTCDRYFALVSPLGRLSLRVGKIERYSCEILRNYPTGGSETTRSHLYVVIVSAL